MRIRGLFQVLREGALTLKGGLKTTLPYIVGWSEKYKEVTEEYPDRVSARMPEDLPQRFRGFLKNDIDRCSGCRLCAEVCPVDCIRIESEPGPEKGHSWVAVFDIDNARCMFCGLCVEVCPTGSLTHTREYEGAVYHLKDMVSSHGKGWATTDMKERWRVEQQAKEALEEERALTMKSPVGSELRRLMREKKE